MTCTGCEHSVNAALTLKEGVVEASSSYETGTATIKFDRTKVSIDELAEAVEKETGYKVTTKITVSDTKK
jgi:copper chaperone CopZ